VEGLPPFEVAFVVDGNVPGLKTGEITIDISGVNKPDKVLLEALTWEAIGQVGSGTETGYRAAIISYRDAETYKELDALGIYVADQHTAEAKKVGGLVGQLQQANTAGQYGMLAYQILDQVDYLEKVLQYGFGRSPSSRMARGDPFSPILHLSLTNLSSSRARMVLMKTKSPQEEHKER
jgi:hypothetical protein